MHKPKIIGIFFQNDWKELEWLVYCLDLNQIENL